MDRVVDLTAADSQGAEALDRTGTDGLLGSAYLHDEPPATYLFDAESPMYLVRNKKAGLDVAGETDIEAAEPDGDHQALALVTDLRLLFLVGDADGDRVQSIPLADVDGAHVERGGLRTQDLTVETGSGATLTFPSRGDVGPVAEYVDRAASVWTAAQQTVERAADATDAAAADVEAGEFDAAREAIADLEDYLEPALRALGDLGPAALEEALPEARRRVRRARALRRQSHAGSGAKAHARAQSAWAAGEYEAAATAYGEALAAYARAQESEGDVPAPAALARRVRGAAAERAVLRRAPLWDLLSLKRRAAATDDPDAAGETWDEALALARSLETRDWPFPDEGLEVASELRWDTVSECAREAVEARDRAAKRWAAAGDRLGDGELTPTARAAYERAADHAERALSLANESVPDRVATVEETAATVTARLGEDTAPAGPASPEGPLAADVLAELVGEEGAGSADDTPVGDAGGEPPAVAAGASASGDAAEAGEAPGDTLPPGYDLPPGLEDEFATADAPAGAEERPSSSASGGNESTATDAEVTGTVDDAGVPPDEGPVRERLETLDTRGLTDLVASLWQRRGWSTMVLPETGATVYDILGAKGTTDADRLLVWTVHRPDGDIEEGYVDRIAETTERGGEDLKLVLVTTAGVPPSVSDRAEDAGLEIVVAEDLASSICEAGLHDRLPDGD